jgi:S-formylglutathione hydrolase FrmB
VVAGLMVLAFLSGVARAATPVSPPSHWPCAGLHYPGDAGGRLQRVTVDSVGVSVVLPTGYATAAPTRYPVLYLFHGYGASSDTWLLKTDLVNFTADQSVIVVMRDGDEGMYVDWRNGTHRWETFDTSTLVHYIDTQYRTLADRSHRAVTGESAGGYAASLYSARHPDTFAIAGPISGFDDLAYLGVGFEEGWANIPLVYDILCQQTIDPSDVSQPFGQPAVDEIWIRNVNPTDLAPNLGSVQLYVGIGTGFPCDPVNDAGRASDIYPTFEAYVHRPMTLNFHAALLAAGTPHTFDELPCGWHDYPYFQQQLHHFWPIMMSAFAHRAEPGPFDYRRADPQFTVWGWDLHADPGRAAEFLDIQNASCAGLTLRGSGAETVTTAPCFIPGERVSLDAGNRGRVLRADGSGRLTFGVDLGPAHTFQQYTAAERMAEVAAGSGYWRTTRVGLVRSGQ